MGKIEPLPATVQSAQQPDAEVPETRLWTDAEELRKLLTTRSALRAHDVPRSD